MRYFMEKLKELLIIWSAIGLLAGGWYACSRKTKATNKVTASTILGDNVEAKIILDSAKHRYTLATRNGNATDVRTGYLPYHTIAVEVLKNKTIKVQTQTFGTEISPFIGFAF